SACRVGPNRFIGVLQGVLQIVDDIGFLRSKRDDRGGGGALVRFAVVPKRVAQYTELILGGGRESVFNGTKFAGLGAGLCRHEVAIAFHQFFGDSGATHRIATSAEVRRAPLFDTDEKSSAGAL